MKKKKEKKIYIKKCVGCGKEFSTYIKRKRYHSYLCSYENRKGKIRIKKTSKDPVEEYKKRVKKEIDRLSQIV